MSAPVFAQEDEEVTISNVFLTVADFTDLNQKVHVFKSNPTDLHVDNYYLGIIRDFESARMINFDLAASRYYVALDSKFWVTKKMLKAGMDLTQIRAVQSAMIDGQLTLAEVMNAMAPSIQRVSYRQGVPLPPMYSNASAVRDPKSFRLFMLVEFKDGSNITVMIRFMTTEIEGKALFEELFEGATQVTVQVKGLSVLEAEYEIPPAYQEGDLPIGYLDEGNIALEMALMDEAQAPKVMTRLGDVPIRFSAGGRISMGFKAELWR